MRQERSLARWFDIVAVQCDVQAVYRNIEARARTGEPRWSVESWIREAQSHCDTWAKGFDDAVYNPLYSAGQGIVPEGGDSARLLMKSMAPGRADLRWDAALPTNRALRAVTATKLRSVEALKQVAKARGEDI